MESEVKSAEKVLQPGGEKANCRHHRWVQKVVRQNAHFLKNLLEKSPRTLLIRCGMLNPLWKGRRGGPYAEITCEDDRSLHGRWKNTEKKQMKRVFGINCV